MPIFVWVLVVIAIILAISWFTSMIWLVAKVCLFIIIAAIAYEVLKRLINSGGGSGGPPVAPA